MKRHNTSDRDQSRPEQPRKDRRKTLGQLRKNILREPGISARYLALESLQDSTLKVLPTDRIWPLADRYDIDERERPLAYEILAGSIKRRASLDLLIERIGGRRCRLIEPRLLNILRIGIYQLIFMKQVPAFAAVDLSCKLALLFGGRRQVNFANAVLRTIERTIEDKDAKLTVENEINILPKTSSVGVQFKRRILPSRDEPVSFLSRGYSYPEWLVKRWLERFGFDRTKELLAAGNGRPAIMCRPNVLKFRELCGINTLVDAGGKLADRLAAEGCRAIKLGEFGTVEISDGPAITTLPSFQEGLFQLQNVTSQRIVHAVGVREGQKILDLCAGLGTKTTQIAELTFDRAKVCATDRSEAKLEKLRTNADRLGITGIEILPLAAISSGQYDGAFDVALADVPCSNTGVLDSRPEVRWRLKQTDLAIFARGALELLALASRLTAPAGRIGYSTCSIDRDENEKVVQEFMARVAGWRLIDEHTEYPSADPESGKTRRQGGYWATLERAG